MSSNLDKGSGNVSELEIFGLFMGCLFFVVTHFTTFCFRFRNLSFPTYVLFEEMGEHGDNKLSPPTHSESDEVSFSVKPGVD